MSAFALQDLGTRITVRCCAARISPSLKAAEVGAGVRSSSHSVAWGVPFHSQHGARKLGVCVMAGKKGAKGGKKKTKEQEDVVDEEEAELEAAIEELFAQLARDLEADSDVDGESFLEGADDDVELTEEEIDVMQRELVAALEEIEGEEDGEDEDALEQEIGGEEVEEEEEDEEEEGEEDSEGEEEESAKEREEEAVLKVQGPLSGSKAPVSSSARVPGLEQAVESLAAASAPVSATAEAATTATIASAAAIAASRLGGASTRQPAAAEALKSGDSSALGTEGGEAAASGSLAAKNVQKAVEARGADSRAEIEEGESEEEEEGVEYEVASAAEEKQRRVVRLEAWQVKKLVNALRMGRRQVNVKVVAAETRLDRRDVLAWLRNPPPGTEDLIRQSQEDADAKAALAADVSAAVLPPPVSGVHPVAGVQAPVPTGGSNSSGDALKEDLRWSKGKRIKQEHLDTLEGVYQRTHYPTNSVVASLVSVTHLPRRRILAWFEARRAKSTAVQARKK